MKKNIMKLMALFALAHSYQTKPNNTIELIPQFIGCMVLGNLPTIYNYFTKTAVPYKEFKRPQNLTEFIAETHKQWLEANRWREADKEALKYASGGWFCYGSAKNKKIGEMGKNRMNKKKKVASKNMSPEL